MAYRTPADEDFLTIARERFRASADAESELRQKMLDDIRFYQGQQWPDNIKQQRIIDGRPCLVINRLPAFVHQVTNEVRQNKPSPDVSPVDDTGDKETAEVMQGIIRHIERQSKADLARSYATFYSVVCGRGYYRLITDYADPMSRDQEIYIRRIKNPFSVYMDPDCQQPDYSDAKYAFVVEDIDRDDFKATYPGVEDHSAADFRSLGDDVPYWRLENKVRIAEYFTRELQDVPVAVLQDGSEIPLEQVPQGMPVMAQRVIKLPVVTWYKIDGCQILEQSQWAGQWIPIIPVLGEEYDIDGKTELVGMVRGAKDSQRMLNYWESCKTETIALAPRIPYIGAEGQFENHEKEWAAANQRNFAYLQYKATSVNGHPVGPPQRQVFEPPIQAITIAQAGAADNMKSVTGIYDASLGNRSNETSGVAIRRRQAEGDIANYHFMDNLTTAVTHEGRILVDLIPKIYDRPGRVVRIIGEDGSEKRATLNAEHENPPNSGLIKYFDLGAGKYDIAVNVGPSYATKRQESAEAMLQFAQIAPELVPRYADLLVTEMDWPGADAIADRIRPPDVPKEGEPPVPPQAQAKMRQLDAMNAQLTQALNETVSLLNSKQLELQSKERMQTQALESKERISAQDAQIKLTTEAAKLGSAEDIALMHAQVASLKARLDMLSTGVPVEATQEPPAPPAMNANVVSPQVQQPQQGPPVNGGFEGQF